MTKKKTGHFSSAWMDETVDEEMLRERIKNEPGKTEAGPIIAAVKKQRGIWDFYKQRRDAEPNPSHWAGLILDIPVPVIPDPFAVIELRQRVRRLPLLVKGVLNTHIYLQTGVGWIALLEHPNAADLARFGESLRELGESARFLKGKRGPKWNCGPALTAVMDAILNHSDLTQAGARALAADLLDICGIRVPLDKSQQIQRTKK